jgi:hypothetical protein
VSRTQDLATLKHPAIALIAMLLLVGFLTRTTSPARIAVRHLEVLFHADALHASERVNLSPVTHQAWRVFHKELLYCCATL